MASSRGKRSLFQRLVDRIFRRGASQQAAGGLTGQRSLRFEPLEGRALLATDLAAITGIVSIGAPVVGANIELFSDVDNDGLFEPGGDDLAAIATDLTDATGRYRFDGLSAGNYFVRQPAQTVGLQDLGQFVSPQINISATEAMGIAGTSIDDFNNAVVQTVTGTNAVPTASDASDHAGALGGERDLFVQLTSGGPGESVTLDSQVGRLMFNSTDSAQGDFIAVYDGNDNDALATAFTGLASEDLTDGGASTGLQLSVRADQANATLRVRLYTDATNYSDASFTIPVGITDTDVVLDYASDFGVGAGAAGAATFTNIGAIEVFIDTNTNGTDGRVSLLGAFGPTIETQNITNQADLSLTKDVDDPTPDVGDDIVYTLVVSNAGTAGATNIEVEDVLPAGTDFVSFSATQGTYDDVTSIWTVGDVGVGGTATLMITATVLTPGAKVNTAEISASDQPDPDSTPGNNVPGEDDQDDVTATPTQIDLSLTKDVNDTTPNRNQNVTFTITVANAGPDQATGVVVEDLLPAGIAFVSSNASQGNYDDGMGVWTVGTINSGEDATLEIVGTVQTIGAKTNTAEIVAADQDDVDSTPDGGEDEDDLGSVTVTPTVADISVTKTVNDATPDRNQQITFTVIVANAGPDQATGVAVTDLLPAGLNFVSFTATQGSYVSGTGIWTVGTINSAANATLTITAATATIGTKTNTAELTALDQFDSDSTPNNQNGQEDDQDSQDVTPNVADLSITKTVTDNTPDRNQQVTFTVVLSNAGPQDATGVTVTDLLPAGLNFVTSTQTQGSYVSGTGVWTVGTIANAGSATLTITATTATIGAKTNTAEVTASNQFDPDSTPGNAPTAEDDLDSEVVTPTVADLSVTKTVDNPTQIVGQNVVFTITVNNAGPDAANNVALSDVLPSGLAFVGFTASQGAYDNNTGVWTIGSIANGGSATLSITATVVNVGQKNNIAQISASNQFDPDSTPGNSLAEDDQDGETVTPPPRFSKRLFLSRPPA